MNYTDKLKRQNGIYAVLTGALIVFITLLLWGLLNKYQDNEYLAAELNKTQKEKVAISPYFTNEEAEEAYYYLSATDRIRLDFTKRGRWSGRSPVETSKKKPVKKSGKTVTNM